MNETGRIRRGSCLCGRVRFLVTGTIRRVGQCLCSQCRKVSGTNGNAQFLVPNSAFSWDAGENDSFKFSLPSGWGVLRCSSCGSPLPESHDGQRTWVPAGLMDDDLNTEISVRIFCGSRADWDVEAETLRHFDRFPPKDGAA